MGLHKTKKSLYSKGNNKKPEKETYEMVENICKPHISHELIYKTYKEVINSRGEKKNKSVKNWQRI